MINQFNQQIINNLRDKYPEAINLNDDELLELYTDWDMSDKSEDFEDWLKED